MSVTEMKQELSRLTNAERIELMNALILSYRERGGALCRAKI